MNDISLRVQGLGKRYRLRHERSRATTLQEALLETVARPFRRAGAVLRGGAAGASSELFWALRDISFELRRGEVLGIIGPNGSGKSTLLKILSRVTEPTEGRAELHGRVGSLLEVGTGFHPELSGRDNIYLNGAVLGMKRAETQRRFDEIVAFAEIEKFLDTPVKHYSSGMYMRLAFAVAAHLDPEILLVDEVLSVGDAQFQKRCLGKMDAVAREGRTVLFVSHNMGAISRLCGRGIWIDQGRIRAEGAAAEVVGAYLSSGLTDQAERRWLPEEAPGDDVMRLLAVRVCQDGKPTVSLDITKPIEIELETEVRKPTPEVVLVLRIVSSDGQIVLHTADVLSAGMPVRLVGRGVSVCTLPPHALNAGRYSLTLGAEMPHVRVVFAEENVLSWTVEATASRMCRYAPGAWRGVLGPGLASWSVRGGHHAG